MRKKENLDTLARSSKIVVSIGPATCTEQAVGEMIDAGARVFRFNCSHQSLQTQAEWLALVRKVSAEKNIPIAAIQDLMGPKMRLGDFDWPVSFAADATVRLSFADRLVKDTLPTQFDLTTRVKVGERVFFNDGRMRGRVSKIDGVVLEIQLENSGTLVSRKGINLPDTDFSGEIITAKDRADVTGGADLGFDYVAFSFVQSAADVRELREIMRSNNDTRPIIAKIESPTGVANLEDITRESDGVMVARGDLAPEVGFTQVPFIQQEILRLAHEHGKEAIVATQMLISMVEAPYPTRAEVSDVALASLGGADGLMLSDETTVGKFPAVTVSTMREIIVGAEGHADPTLLRREIKTRFKQTPIAEAAVILADELGAAAIVTETRTGETARAIAQARPSCPQLAVTPEERVANRLALSWGVTPFVRANGPDQAVQLAEELVASGVLERGATVVICTGRQPGVSGTTDTLRVYRAGK